jgi:hypothetical protein
MATRFKIMQAFYNKIINFLSFLEQQFPDERDIIKIKTSIELLPEKKILLDNYINNVGPFAQFIFEKRDSYFITEFGNGNLNDHYYNELSIKIKMLWLKMNNFQKEMVWETFQSLLKIGHAFYNTNE